MVEFLGPKIFTIFVIIINALVTICFSSYFFYYNILPILLALILVVFWVSNNVKLAFIANFVVFAIGDLVLLIFLFIYIFYTDPVNHGKVHWEMGFPTSYVDHVNYQYRMGLIGFYALLIVANFANMLVYKVHYSQVKENTSIPNQPIMATNELEYSSI